MLISGNGNAGVFILFLWKKTWLVAMTNLLFKRYVANADYHVAPG